MNTREQVRLLNVVRYGGLVLVGAWIATIALFPRSAAAGFLVSPTGKALVYTAVAINLLGLVGLLVLRNRRR